METSYDGECIICYDTDKSTLLKPCLSCSTMVCSACWYDACRMYCPLCSREELNAPKQCSYCGKKMHIKDVWACCVCCLWVCKLCETETTSHPCRILRDRTQLQCAQDIVGLCFIRMLQGISSCPLGRIAKTTIVVTLSKKHVLIWFHCKTAQAKAFARSRKMSKLELQYGNVIAYKSYYLLHKKCKRYIDAFLAKCGSNLFNIEPHPTIIRH